MKKEKHLKRKENTKLHESIESYTERRKKKKVRENYVNFVFNI